MKDRRRPIRGRGSADNPKNRFESSEYVPDPEAVDPDAPRPQTQFFDDTSRSIITYNNSPDLGFDASINPYRGCEHGCIYCYARPTHEYLGYSAGLDFETKIHVKRNAAALLRKELASPKWKPQVLAISGVTDPYQPAERRLCLTRDCLEVLAEFRNPTAIVTKNHLVTRDVDRLKTLAAHDAAAVFVSITTLDADLARIMEPRTSPPFRRLEAIAALSRAGVPAGVMIAPVIPGLTEHELAKIIEAARQAGASAAAYIVLRLPLGVASLFETWLETHLPDHKKKVLARVRAVRGGQLSDSRFGSRMRGGGIFAEQLASMFAVACKRAGMPRGRQELSTAAFRRPSPGQLGLFDLP
jgi:DNA repair photolyase